MTDDLASGPVVLKLAGITKRFGGLLANTDIDLELRAGEIVALLGENGAGKTTLMSILFGHYVADAGKVLVRDPAGELVELPPGSPRAALEAGIGMVHQHFKLADNLSTFDNIVLGTERLSAWRRHARAMRRRLEALSAASGLEVRLDARIGDLAVGERQRVEILKALYRQARILVLDEPTAVLTPQEVDRLFGILRRLAAQGLAIIFISHKLGEVMQLCRRVAVLRGGRKVAETPVAQSSPAALAEAMIGRPILPRRPEALAPGAPLLELAAVRASMGHGQALLDADLVVHAYEIVGVAGVSGNGQQTLSSVVAGLVAPESGRLRLLGKSWPGADPGALRAAGMGRIPEDRDVHGVVGDFPVADNLALERYAGAPYARAGLVRRRQCRTEAVRLMRAFDVRAPGPQAATRLLSGGNVQKLILARALDDAPRLILADQPTRGLDVGAVSQVHGRLLDARRGGTGILLISEDLEELLLADRIAVIHRGRLGEALPARSVTARELGLMMAGQHRYAA